MTGFEHDAPRRRTVILRHAGSVPRIVRIVDIPRPPEPEPEPAELPPANRLEAALDRLNAWWGRNAGWAAWVFIAVVVVVLTLAGHY